MATRRSVTSYVEKLGGKVEVVIDPEDYTIYVDAPDGMQWVDGSTPHIVEHQFRGPWGTGEIWGDVLERVKCGLEPYQEG